MSPRRVRIGTRGSALALWQARWFENRLAEALPGLDTEIVPIRTRGDRGEHEASSPVAPGYFTSDIEIALAEGRIDAAVHSLKDLPVAESPALEIAAYPVRGDPADALIARDGLSLVGLPAGAVVGTSSPRRTSLVRSMRSDLEVEPIVGNVDTRVRRVDDGDYDAVVLAAAGLTRLGLEQRIAERFDPRRFPPAPGQGTLAVQLRASDEGPPYPALRDAVRGLDDAEARVTSLAERAVLAAMGGGCGLPLGAHAELEGASLRLFAFAGSADGSRVVRAEVVGPDPTTVAQAAAERLEAEGAGDLWA